MTTGLRVSDRVQFQCFCCQGGQSEKKKMDLGINVYEDSFGEDGCGQPVRRFTLTNENRMSVQVITYGATITCIKVPDKRGNVDDVVLGFDDIIGQYF